MNNQTNTIDPKKVLSKLLFVTPHHHYNMNNRQKYKKTKQ